MVFTSALAAGQTTADGGGSAVATVIVLAAVGYVLSLLLHPRGACPICKGRGREWGAVFSRSFRWCRRCGGDGHVQRAGTRPFGGGD